MNKGRYIIGLDAGTTSVRSVVYDTKTKKIVCLKREKIRQFYPQKGWVEEDAEEIFFMLRKTMEEAILEMDKPITEYIGVGLTNQRETIVAFNKDSGKCHHRAIVWQDRRTNENINRISDNFKNVIKEKTGLIPDAYFSASKMQWLIKNSKRISDLNANNKLFIGTLDSYLAYKFTGNFVTDTTNASRTMLMNIKTQNWDDELLSFFGVKIESLPKIISCNTNVGIIKEFGIPLLSIMGDQQASMLGNGVIYEGMAKNTYGTGCFILINTGDKLVASKKILSTIGYTISGKTTYALEGSVFSACSALNWAKENLDIQEDFDSLDKKMQNIGTNSGVYFVPAFTGLGAPYWNPNAGALIYGLTYDSNKYSIMRSVYESMAYNTKAIIDEMTNTNNLKLKELRVDGGGTKSKFLLNFQADMINAPVITLQSTESTVLGAIYMAGITAGILKLQDVSKLAMPEKQYLPQMDTSVRNDLYAGWKNAVNKLSK